MSKVGKKLPGFIKKPIIGVINGSGRLKGKIYMAARDGKIPFPDKAFQKWDYKVNTGRKLNLNNPQLFAEKLQWLKYYYHDPLYSTLVDKYSVREWVKDKIGEQYLTPLYGVYDSYEDINYEELPDSFVLKCTHDSGSVVLCRNKKNFDFEHARSVLETGLKRKQFYLSREWPYKSVKPRIIAEKYLIDDFDDDAPDYKFFCFDGKVKFLLVNSERHSESGCKTNFYTGEWERLPMKESDYENNTKDDVKPEKFDEMIKFAEILSHGMPHVRVDFNYVNNEIYFGEMTFYHCGGRKLFKPFEYNKIFGDFIKLPQKKR